MMDSWYVAYFDALGFKGIWQRHEGHEQSVIDRLKSIKSRAEEVISRGGIAQFVKRTPPHADFRCEVRFLSDSVIVATQGKANTDGKTLPYACKGLALTLACVVAAEVVCDGAHVGRFDPIDNPVILPYRGAISYGQFLMDDNFLVGPAIDEALEQGSAIDGAMVVLCDSVEKSAQRIESELGVNTRMFKDLEAPLENWQYGYVLPVVPMYPVPIKGGEVITRAVLNPLEAANSRRDNNWRSRLLARMNDPDESIQRKRSNTEAYLETAERFASNPILRPQNQ